MLIGLRTILTRWFGSAGSANITEPSSSAEEETMVLCTDTSDEQEAVRVPYDENLLERARTQWQFGDWESLAALERDQLQYHPDRGKLALLAAAGWAQIGDTSKTRALVRLAQDWGVNNNVISRILIAGVHNSLGRAAILGKQQERALKHFETTITIGTPAADQRLLTQARINQQSVQLGLGRHGADPSSGGFALSGRSMACATISTLARQCVESPDVHKAVDGLRASNRISPRETFLLFIELADHYFERKDDLTTVHFLQNARELIDDETNEQLKTLLVRNLIVVGKADLAADLAMEQALLSEGHLALNSKEKAALLRAYQQTRQKAEARSEHGHDLLLNWLRKHAEELKTETRERVPVLVEIGSTRENVPGQGSTRKLAVACKELGLHFITVDMDPHNSRMAAEVFTKLEVPFEAITDKGEDYLRNYQGYFDYIFLDAYDFDHGKHSELRQSRYRKFLGEQIDDEECHRMHLDCAESIVAKLALKGVVCLDDTWLDDGSWTAKGTLAMPYLLANGFRLLEARNRAVLLARGQGGSSVSF
ncbi:MAG: hypothetical protein WD071_14960 [Pseudohongiella sp.]|uniref:hypothetical protein n=1 Tax=Pseudohongiella sp. TaxID=1979412 RepID=UPI0034A013AD